MREDEFINRVMERTGIDKPDKALEIVKAVLETLGERLYRTEASHLSAQLPKGLKEFVFARHEPERSPQDVERISLEEFYNRVRARAEIGFPAAVRHAKAVVAVIREAVSEGELKDIFKELPHEYSELLEG